jgi:hypothetical protein
MHATHIHSPLERVNMTAQWKRILISAATIIVPILLTSCLLTKVTQPASVVKGTQVTVVINGYDSNVPSTGAVTDKGVLCILVPTDWSFVSATDSAKEKGAAYVHHGVLTSAQNWKDSATAILPPPAGMKWIGLLSDSAYVYNDTLNMTATVVLQAGQTTGTYFLGYMMTKNGGDLMSHFSDGFSDTLMNVPITVTPATGVETQSLGGTPTAYELRQNYPNPFNPSTEIQFTVVDRGNVSLKVFDVAGREVAVLADGIYAPGDYRVKFSPENLASGMYLYTLRVGGFTETRKMVYMR